MIVRSGGFYHGDDPEGPEPRDTAALAILVVIVATVGSAVVVLTRALLLTAGR